MDKFLNFYYKIRRKNSRKNTQEIRFPFTLDNLISMHAFYVNEQLNVKEGVY